MGNNILVTGGAGSIGSELVRQLSENNRVIVFDINETAMFDLVEELQLEGRDVEGKVGDVRDENSLMNYFLGKERPTLIINASALKHVTPCEWDPKEAVMTNVIGTHNLINLAKGFGIPLINISTDKVVNPKSVMGMTKAIAERMVRNAGFVSVRFANVLGSRGSVIPIWQKQADENKPLTITDSRMERYFMSIPQAVKLIIKAINLGDPGDVIVLEMGQPMRIIDLAKEIIEKSGKNLGIREIGARPGESLTEELMSAEEKQKAIKEGDYWIIKDK